MRASDRPARSRFARTIAGHWRPGSDIRTCSSTWHPSPSGKAGRTRHARRSKTLFTPRPPIADVWKRLGLLQATGGRVEQARDAFAKAISAAPDPAGAVLQPRHSRAADGNETAAEKHLRQALERNPSYAEAHYELATGYLAAGRPAACTGHLSRRPRGTAPIRRGPCSAPRRPRSICTASRKPGATTRRSSWIAPPEYATQVAAAREAIRRLQNR